MASKSFTEIYISAWNGVKTWLIDPIKQTVDFILDNALKLAAGILAFPIFLLMYPLAKVASSGIFNHPPPRTHRSETTQDPGDLTGKIKIAVIGATGVGKSSLINGFRGLKDKDLALGAAPVGEIDCTKHKTPYVDKRFPWIVWLDIPGAGTEGRTSDTYFEEQGLKSVDFILVVYADRVRELDIAILKCARDHKIPAALVRSKADNDLRQRAKRECDDSDNEEEIKGNIKSVKAGYVKEIRGDMKRQMQMAGIQDYFTPEKCFIVSAKILRGLMISTKDLPELRGMDENSYQRRITEIKAAVMHHVQRLASGREEIDEKKLIGTVFTTIAEDRYNIDTRLNS